MTLLAKLKHASWPARLGHDISASVVVFLLGLPIAMGVALASGADISAGLVAAMVGGVVAGTLSGAPMQVSGPVVGLAMLTHHIIATYGFAAMCLVTIAAGVMQLVFAVARLGRFAQRVPHSVLQGMMAGIGIQVVLAQFYVVLGNHPHSSTWEDFVDLPAVLSAFNHQTVMLAIIAAAVTGIWRHIPLLRRVPSALGAVTCATWVTWLMAWPVPKVQLSPHMFNFLHIEPDILPVTVLIKTSFAVATIGSLHSLLSAIATDQRHAGPRLQPNRELMSQGMANVVSGFVGGLPVSGVLLRSSANVAAGARTRVSTILHGTWTFLAVAFLGGLLQDIPQAALAVLFMVVGTKLVRENSQHLGLRAWDSAIHAVTLAGVLFLDVLWGIGLGVALAMVAAWAARHARASA